MAKHVIDLSAPLNVQQYDGTIFKTDHANDNRQLYSGEGLSNSLTVARNGYYFNDKSVVISPSRNTYYYNDDYSSEMDKAEVTIKNLQGAFQVKHKLPDGTSYTYNIGLGQVRSISNWMLLDYSRESRTNRITIRFNDIFGNVITLKYDQDTLGNIEVLKNGIADPEMEATLAFDGNYLGVNIGVRQTDKSYLQVWRGDRETQESDVQMDVTRVVTDIANDSYTYTVQTANGQIGDIAYNSAGIQNTPYWMDEFSFNGTVLRWINNATHNIDLTMNRTMRIAHPQRAQYTGSQQDAYGVRNFLSGTGWPDFRDGEWRSQITLYNKLFMGQYLYQLNPTNPNNVIFNSYTEQEFAPYRLYRTPTVESFSNQPSYITGNPRNFTYTLPPAWQSFDWISPTINLNSGSYTAPTGYINAVCGSIEYDWTINLNGTHQYWALPGLFQTHGLFTQRGLGKSPIVPGSVKFEPHSKSSTSNELPNMTNVRSVLFDPHGGSNSKNLYVYNSTRWAYGFLGIGFGGGGAYDASITTPLTISGVSTWPTTWYNENISGSFSAIDADGLYNISTNLRSNNVRTLQASGGRFYRSGQYALSKAGSAPGSPTITVNVVANDNYEVTSVTQVNPVPGGILYDIDVTDGSGYGTTPSGPGTWVLPQSTMPTRGEVEVLSDQETAYNFVSTDILDPGDGFNVGQVITITSDSGINHTATVTAIRNEYWRFDSATISDPGEGYSFGQILTFAGRDWQVTGVRNEFRLNQYIINAPGSGYAIGDPLSISVPFVVSDINNGYAPGTVIVTNGGSGFAVGDVLHNLSGQNFEVGSAQNQYVLNSTTIAAPGTDFKVGEAYPIGTSHTVIIDNIIDEFTYANPPVTVINTGGGGEYTTGTIVGINGQQYQVVALPSGRLSTLMLMNPGAASPLDFGGEATVPGGSAVVRINTLQRGFGPVSSVAISPNTGVVDFAGTYSNVSTSGGSTLTVTITTNLASGVITSVVQTSTQEVPNDYAGSWTVYSDSSVQDALIEVTTAAGSLGLLTGLTYTGTDEANNFAGTYNDPKGAEITVVTDLISGKLYSISDPLELISLTDFSGTYNPGSATIIVTTTYHSELAQLSNWTPFYEYTNDWGGEYMIRGLHAPAMIRINTIFAGVVFVNVRYALSFQGRWISPGTTYLYSDEDCTTVPSWLQSTPLTKVLSINPDIMVGPGVQGLEGWNIPPDQQFSVDPSGDYYFPAAAGARTQQIVEVTGTAQYQIAGINYYAVGNSLAVSNTARLEIRPEIYDEEELVDPGFYISIGLLTTQTSFGISPNNWDNQKRFMFFTFSSTWGRPSFWDVWSRWLVSWDISIMTDPFPEANKVELHYGRSFVQKSGDEFNYLATLMNGRNRLTVKTRQDDELVIGMSAIGTYPINNNNCFYYAGDSADYFIVDYQFVDETEYPDHTFLGVDVFESVKQTTFTNQIQLARLDESAGTGNIATSGVYQGVPWIIPLVQKNMSSNFRWWFDTIYPSTTIGFEIYASDPIYGPPIGGDVMPPAISNIMQGQNTIRSNITFTIQTNAEYITLPYSVFSVPMQVRTYGSAEIDSNINNLRVYSTSSNMAYNNSDRTYVNTTLVSVGDGYPSNGQDSRGLFTITETSNGTATPTTLIGWSRSRGQLLNNQNISVSKQNPSTDTLGTMNIAIRFNDGSNQHRFTFPNTGIKEQVLKWLEYTVTTIQETMGEVVVSGLVGGINQELILNKSTGKWTFSGFYPEWVEGPDPTIYNSYYEFVLKNGNFSDVRLEQIGLISSTLPNHQWVSQTLTDSSFDYYLDVPGVGQNRWHTWNPDYVVIYKMVLSKFSEDYKRVDTILEIDVTNERSIRYAIFPKKEDNTELPLSRNLSFINSTTAVDIGQEFYYIFKQTSDEDAYPQLFTENFGTWELQAKHMIDISSPHNITTLVAEKVSSAAVGEAPVHVKVYQVGSKLYIYTRPAGSMINDGPYQLTIIPIVIGSPASNSIFIQKEEGTIFSIDQVNFVNEYTQRFFNVSSIGGQTLIGIRLQDVMLQWVIVLQGSALIAIVKGYSQVGLNGDLTGGIWPLKYLGGSGFNKAVTIATAEENLVSKTLIDGVDSYIIRDGSYYFLTASDELQAFARWNGSECVYFSANMQIGGNMVQQSGSSGNLRFGMSTSTVDPMPLIGTKLKYWGMALSISTAITGTLQTVKDIVSSALAAWAALKDISGQVGPAGTTAIADAAKAIGAAALFAALNGAVNAGLKVLLGQLVSVVGAQISQMDFGVSVPMANTTFYSKSYANIGVSLNNWYFDSNINSNSIGTLISSAQNIYNYDEVISTFDELVDNTILFTTIKDAPTLITETVSQSLWSQNDTRTQVTETRKNQAGTSAYTTISVPWGSFFHVNNDSHIYAGPGFVQWQAYFHSSNYNKAEVNIVDREFSSTLDLSGVLDIAALKEIKVPWFNVKFSASDAGLEKDDTLPVIDISFGSAFTAKTKKEALSQVPINVNSNTGIGYVHLNCSYPISEPQTIDVPFQKYGQAIGSTDLSTVAVGAASLPTIYIQDLSQVLSKTVPYSVICGLLKINPIKENSVSVEVANPLAKVIQSSAESGFSQSFAYPNVPAASSNPPSGLFDAAVIKPFDFRRVVSGTATVALTVRDCNLIDGKENNILLNNDGSMLVAAPNYLIRVDSSVDHEKLIGKMFSNDVFGFTFTGSNGIYKQNIIKLYDGYFNRIKYLMGGSSVANISQNSVQTFRPNQVITANNIAPPSSYFGNFNSLPKFDTDQSISVYCNFISYYGKETPSQYRYAVPMISSKFRLNPPFIKTQSGVWPLSIFNNSYSPVTLLRGSDLGVNNDYVDFTIYGNQYRYTGEMIIPVTKNLGVEIYGQPIPAQGLRYIESSTTNAFFYSNITRRLYRFTGSDSIVPDADLTRMAKLVKGTWSIPMQRLFLMFEDGTVVSRSDEQFDYVVTTPADFNGNLVSGMNGLAFDKGTSFEISEMVLNSIGTDSIRNNMGHWVVNADRTRTYEDGYPDQYVYQPFYYLWAPMSLQPAGGDITVDHYDVTLALTDSIRLINEGYTQRVFIRSIEKRDNETIEGEWQCYYFNNEDFNDSRLTIRYSPQHGIVSKTQIEIYSDDLIMLTEATVDWEASTTERIVKVTNSGDVDRNARFVSNSFVDNYR